jgi:hypothetical protein
MRFYKLLDKWRKAGVEVGRKVGVVNERYRILDLIQWEIHQAWAAGAILKANYLLDIKHKISKGKN